MAKKITSVNKTVQKDIPKTAGSSDMKYTKSNTLATAHVKKDCY